MLVSCQECGHKVSDKAIYCPECGCPVRQTHSADSASSDTNNADKTENISSDAAETASQPYQYKYHYTPKKRSGCKGCLIAFLIVLLLVVLLIGGMVYSCTNYVINWTSTTETFNSGIIDDFIDEFSDENNDETDEFAELDSVETVTELDATVVMQGYIGGTNYPITMTLMFDEEGDVSGSYYYDGQGETTSIGLTGNYQSPYLTLYENNVQDGKQAAYFEGKYDMETFAGSYTNTRQQEYAFKLIVKDDIE